MNERDEGSERGCKTMMKEWWRTQTKMKTKENKG